MNTLAYRQLPPSIQDAAIARASGQSLSLYAKQKTPLRLNVQGEKETNFIQLPPSAVALLMDILEVMASGRGITIIPENAELTSVEAAEILNVSRPFLIKLLDEGKIPHRKVGKHRRIMMEDLMSYKSRIDKEREIILDQLAAEAQVEKMGYE